MCRLLLFPSVVFLLHIFPVVILFQSVSPKYCVLCSLCDSCKNLNFSLSEYFLIGLMAKFTSSWHLVLRNCTMEVKSIRSNGVYRDISLITIRICPLVWSVSFDCMMLILYNHPTSSKTPKFSFWIFIYPTALEANGVSVTLCVDGLAFHSWNSVNKLLGPGT